MAQIARQNLSETPLNPTFANATTSGGDKIDNDDGATILHLKNGGASSATVTVTAQDTSEEVAGFGAMTKADLVVTVPAGAERLVGPLPKRAFNDADGNLNLAYGGAGAADVDVAAYRAVGLQKV